MPLTRGEDGYMWAPSVAFVGALVHSFPVLLPLLEEHLEDEHGMVLATVFLSDVVRWAEAEVAQQPDLVRAMFLWLDDQYRKSGPEIRADLLQDAFLWMLSSPGKPGAELRGFLGPEMAARAKLRPYGPG